MAFQSRSCSPSVHLQQPCWVSSKRMCCSPVGWEPWGLPPPFFWAANYMLCPTHGLLCLPLWVPSALSGCGCCSPAFPAAAKFWGCSRVSWEKARVWSVLYTVIPYAASAPLINGLSGIWPQDSTFTLQHGRNMRCSFHLEVVITRALCLHF